MLEDVVVVVGVGIFENRGGGAGGWINEVNFLSIANFKNSFFSLSNFLQVKKNLSNENFGP